MNNGHYLLGLDIGSSSVKVSVVDAESGAAVSQHFMPETEMSIYAAKPGWAEQDPETWYSNMKSALRLCLSDIGGDPKSIAAIGISYQMHGLVAVDRQQKVLRPAIIWCDSRAVSYGQQAMETLGSDFYLEHLLNSPGNFTAAKLAWVKDNEPDIYDKIDKIMLPGDYIAMRLTGDVATTVSGLSEGIFWDFKRGERSAEVMKTYGFIDGIIPPVVPTFGIQGTVCRAAADDLGLAEGTPVSYRAGDQPNNALSLGVMQLGEVAATGGTSGVVYGVRGDVGCDRMSRVNTFAHVNHSMTMPRLGVLLCINGTGILNAWMRRNVAGQEMTYADINRLAMTAPTGADGLTIIPFGNGAERVLRNADIGASIHGINFNIHTKAHLLRAAQEGIAFSFAYGMEVMRQMGMDIRHIKAGQGNMFLSPLFTQTLADITGTAISLYATDGAAGAAKGAGIGAGIYRDSREAFATLALQSTVEPHAEAEECTKAYIRWKQIVEKNV